jgi:hypothetical protein
MSKALGGKRSTGLGRRRSFLDDETGNTEVVDTLVNNAYHFCSISLAWRINGIL